MTNNPEIAILLKITTSNKINKEKVKENYKKCAKLKKRMLSKAKIEKKSVIFVFPF